MKAADQLEAAATRVNRKASGSCGCIFFGSSLEDDTGLATIMQYAERKIRENALKLYAVSVVRCLCRNSAKVR